MPFELKEETIPIGGKTLKEIREIVADLLVDPVAISELHIYIDHIRILRFIDPSPHFNPSLRAKHLGGNKK